MFNSTKYCTFYSFFPHFQRELLDETSDAYIFCLFRMRIVSKSSLLNYTHFFHVISMDASQSVVRQQKSSCMLQIMQWIYNRLPYVNPLNPIYCVPHLKFTVKLAEPSRHQSKHMTPNHIVCVLLCCYCWNHRIVRWGPHVTLSSFSFVLCNYIEVALVWLAGTSTIKSQPSSFTPNEPKSLHQNRFFNSTVRFTLLLRFAIYLS